jgi:hypothetical protein
MEDKLLELVRANCITIVTGPICSGKSWLLDKVSNESHAIDMKDLMDSNRLKLLSSESFKAVQDSKVPFITIDEAQALAGQQLISLASHAVNSGKKLIIACQSRGNIPYSEILGMCAASESPLIHLHFSGWSKEKSSPESFNIHYGSHVSKEDLFYFDTTKDVAEEPVDALTMAYIQETQND